MSKPKYWKTTITATLLTAGENPPDYASLAAAGRDMIDGDASGVYAQTAVEVTEEQMRKLLEEQGSDPEFLIPADEEEDA